MTRRSWPLGVAATLLLALTLAPSPAAQAATFTVTKAADTVDGACNTDCSGEKERKVP